MTERNRKRLKIEGNVEGKIEEKIETWRKENEREWKRMKENKRE